MSLKKSESSSDSFGDEAQLNALGYKQTLHRTWNFFESFMAAFGGMYAVGGLKVAYSTGIYSGGPAALWSSWVITSVFMCITAASLAEICSSIPLSGSIYLWAAESGGKKYGRFFGFVVAFWSTTAWTSFVASTAQATTNFIMSELVVFETFFPGDVDYSNIKFRAVVWIVSEVILLFAILTNFMPPRRFTWIFRASLIIIVLDYLLLLIYLPIGVSKTYGFQTAQWVFTEQFNGTGAPDGWNWSLSFLATAYVLTGYDASGHIAEEVKDASLQAARGVFWSCFASALMGTPLLFLFLVCSPSFDTLFDLAAPQPFVLIYQLALGSAGQIVMTVISIVGLFINMSIAIVAASRLVSAIARDGILPGSEWIGKVDANGQPRNAVTFIGIISALLLCTILPSSVSFTALISSAGLPTIAAYALIPLLRLIFTRGDFKNAKWSNGRWSTPFCAIAVVWNLFVLCVLSSPYAFPVSLATFNFAPVIFVGVTLMGIVAYFIVPDEKWLSRRSIARVLDVTEGKIVTGSDSDLPASKEE